MKYPFLEEKEPQEKRGSQNLLSDQLFSLYKTLTSKDINPKLTFKEREFEFSFCSIKSILYGPPKENIILTPYTKQVFDDNIAYKQEVKPTLTKIILKFDLKVCFIFNDREKEKKKMTQNVKSNNKTV
jgi:hypothetical protein